MTRLLVLHGQPKDPAACDRHCQEVHIQLAKGMKEPCKWTLGKVTGTPSDELSPYYYIADLYMESRADCERLLTSPEGQAAVADVPNYAPAASRSSTRRLGKSSDTAHRVIGVASAE